MDTTMYLNGVNNESMAWCTLVGWQLFGVSFKDKWFLGFSRLATPLADKYD